MAHPKDALRTAALALAILALAGCTQQVAATEAPEAAAKVEAITGAELSKVTLTERAVERLGLKTGLVRKATSGGASTVSFSAVLYDHQGAAWVYTTSSAPRSFVRVPIVVDRVEGDVAYLKRGPKIGTTVVTVGVQELYGAENGVGGE